MYNARVRFSVRKGESWGVLKSLFLSDRRKGIVTNWKSEKIQQQSVVQDHRDSGTTSSHVNAKGSSKGWNPAARV